jgi:hypothetical protein
LKQVRIPNFLEVWIMTSIFEVRGREMSERRTGRGPRRRSNQRFLLEHLEPRTLLTAVLSVNGTGAAAFLSQTLGSIAELSFNAGTHTYTFDDTEGVAPGTVDAAFTYTQVTGTEATLAPVDFNTQNFTSLSFDQNVQNINYAITSLDTPTSFVDTSLTPPVGTPLSDFFDFGNTSHAQSLITAPVTVALTTDSAAIAIDDSADTAPQAINMTSTQVNFNTTPAFTYSGTKVTSLVVLAGSGTADNTVNVTGTPSGASSSVVLGSGNDYVTVTGTGVAATPTPSLTLNGGAGVNTLVVNTTGTTVTSTTAGSITLGTGAEIDYSNFSVTHIRSFPTNTAPVITAAATITAVENVPLVNTVIATFTDADTIENANSYTATIEWGDGSFSAGTVAYTGTAGGVNDYSISGTHTYLTSGAETTHVILTDLGGTFTTTSGGIPSTTTLAALAPVTSAGPTVNVNGLAAGTTPTAPTATAGTAIVSAPLVTFTDAPTPLAATAYSATIDWGDGTGLSGGTIALASGVFTVSGTHNYADAGVYPVRVVIVGDGQQLTLTTSTTVGSPDFSTVPEQTALAGTPTGMIGLGDFTGTAPQNYTATVDWGDGSPPSALFFIPGGGPTLTYEIASTGHTYAQGGNYAVSVPIRDAQGVLVTTLFSAINVTVTPLTGRLTPQSDTGVSNSDGITSDTTPTFVGNTTPGTTVEVFATPSTAPVTTLPGTLIATGAANSAGVWSATVVNTPLTDGSYIITADAVNSAGTVLTTTTLGTIVIDTAPPVVTALTFNRFDDTVTVTYQDGLSGLDIASIANGAFYHLSAKRLAADVPVPKMLLPTAITITPGATATSPVVVTVVFNHGHEVRGGRYFIVINSGTGDNGVQDVAGNALDGSFYGTFPSGDGLAGGDFAAYIDTFHNHIVLAPVPFKDGYVAPGSAVISPPPLQPAAKVKVVRTTAKAKPVVTQAVKMASAHDLAIAALTVDKDKKDKPHHG